MSPPVVVDAKSTILSWMVIAACFCGTTAEVASSVTTMTSLITQEEKLIQHLTKVLDLSVKKGENSTWTTRLERYLDCIERRHKWIAKSAGSLVHPVVGFRLMRRQIKDWTDVTNTEYYNRNTDNLESLYDNLKSMREVTSKWIHWPKSSDITDAAMGLIRIGQTYRLYPRTICYNRINQTLLNQANEAGIQFMNDYGIENIFQSKIRNSSCNSDVCHDRILKLSSNSDGNGEENYSIKRSVLKNDDNSHQTSTHHIALENDKKCFCYDYSTLDKDDVMFITKVAVSQKLKEEATQWFHLLDSIFHDFGPQDNADGKDIEGMKREIDRIPAKKPKKDFVMENYARLCHRSAQASSHPTSPSMESMQCLWKYVYPYLRYNAELLYSSPVIYQFHDVISLREMEHIKDLARTKLSPSSLDTEGRKKKEALYWRVSQTAWFLDETSVLRSLSRRVGQLTGLATGLVSATTDQMDTDYSEPLQVVNYGLGGLYGPHLDTLNHGSADSRHHTGDRLATWMFYLGDVQIGGATVFPFIDLDVKPIKGSAILWYNLLRNGQTDRRTVHAGCPVVIGDKWVANKWVRETAQWKTRPCLPNASL